MDFAEHLRKFIMVDSYKIDLMKGNVILVKVDEMYNILKSASHCREMKMELDDQSFCWSVPLNVHTFTTPLLY